MRPARHSLTRRDMPPPAYVTEPESYDPQLSPRPTQKDLERRRNTLIALRSEVSMSPSLSISLIVPRLGRSIWKNTASQKKK